MCVHGYRENRQNKVCRTAQKMRNLVQTYEKERNEKRVLILKWKRVMIKKNVHGHAVQEIGNQEVDFFIKEGTKCCM